MSHSDVITPRSSKTPPTDHSFGQLTLLLTKTLFSGLSSRCAETCGTGQRTAFHLQLSGTQHCIAKCRHGKPSSSQRTLRGVEENSGALELDLPAKQIKRPQDVAKENLLLPNHLLRQALRRRAALNTFPWGVSYGCGHPPISLPTCWHLSRMERCILLHTDAKLAQFFDQCLSDCLSLGLAY